MVAYLMLTNLHRLDLFKIAAVVLFLDFSFTDPHAFPLLHESYAWENFIQHVEENHDQLLNTNMKVICNNNIIQNMQSSHIRLENGSI